MATTNPDAHDDANSSDSELRSDSDFDGDEKQEEQAESTAQETHKYDLGMEVELTRQRFGIIRYRGDTHFAPGIFFGIELTRGAIGKHNGTVDGTQYFVGPTKKCIFVTEDKIRRVVANADEVKEQAVSQGKATASLAKIRIGHRYMLDDNRYGVCSFVGLTAFAPGEWIGIALEAGKGKHDGSVHNRRYFKCRPGKGIFVRKSRLIRDMGSVKSVGFLSRIETTRRVDMVRESIKNLAEEKQQAYRVAAARRGESDHRVASISGSVLVRAGTVGAASASTHLELETETRPPPPRAMSAFDANQEWQAPDYDITPDHGSYLQDKPMSVQSRKKIDVEEAGKD